MLFYVHAVSIDQSQTSYSGKLHWGLYIRIGQDGIGIIIEKELLEALKIEVAPKVIKKNEFIFWKV